MKLQSYFKFVLITIPVIIISWQLYASNFDTLTSWKGGGYGMYTDSHRYQGYIALKNGDREQHVYPLNTQQINSLDSLSRSYYQNDKRDSRDFIFYPSKYFEIYKHSDYLNSITRKGDTLYFISADLDLEKKSITRHILFKHAL